MCVDSAGVCGDRYLVGIRLPSHRWDCNITATPWRIHVMGIPVLWRGLLFPTVSTYFLGVIPIRLPYTHPCKRPRKFRGTNFFSHSLTIERHADSCNDTSSYCYLTNWLLTVPAELSASSLVISFWLPEGSSFPLWVVPCIIIVVLVVINFLGVVSHVQFPCFLCRAASGGFRSEIKERGGYCRTNLLTARRAYYFILIFVSHLSLTLFSQK